MYENPSNHFAQTRAKIQDKCLSSSKHKQLSSRSYMYWNWDGQGSELVIKQVSSKKYNAKNRLCIYLDYVFFRQRRRISPIVD